MFHVAFPRGQGPVYEDLPPTLQPCAVAHAAPHADHVRAAALSGLIYVLLGGGLVAAASLAPPMVAAPPPPITHGGTITFDGPVTPPLIQRVLPQVGGGNTSTVSPTSTANPAPQQPDPTSAPGGLPTEDHHNDAPIGGGSLNGPQTPATGQGPGTGPIGPTAREYATTGLAVLHQVDPIYPAFARAARIQGPVVLKMTVDERGQPIQVEVLEGHPVFHEAARQAARQWRFEPARMDGQPVIATFRLTLKFSLR
ncbi:MAG TPA: TonB family protein [Holophagaceae bacterium]|nr:TonB family protein [Holophagaceae bacterium]